MKYVITAGGTGGHIYPALAIIDQIKKEDKQADILFIGTHNRMEKDIIPSHDIKYEAITLYGFNKNIVRDLKNLFLLLKSSKKCKKILKEFKPDVVIGFGGYVSFPVLKIAQKLNLKTMIHEQNALPGKANIMISKKVDVVCSSFEKSKQYLRGKKFVVTGNPCGGLALKAIVGDKTKYGLSKEKKLLLIVAGSLGSLSLHNKIAGFLKNNQSTTYEILYVAGKNMYSQIKNEKYADNVKVIEFLDGMTSILKSTDLMISRAGASTISEILALKVPTIFIPSPNVANNHQYYNALALSDIQAGILIQEKDITEELLNKNIDMIIKDDFKKEELKKNMAKIEVLNSQKIFYQEIKDLISNG